MSFKFLLRSHVTGLKLHNSGVFREALNSPIKCTSNTGRTYRLEISFVSTFFLPEFGNGALCRPEGVVRRGKEEMGLDKIVENQKPSKNFSKSFMMTFHEFAREK